MPRLAIVISALGNIESLEGTLLSVLENRPSDSEIIVALNQAYSDPYDLKSEVRFVEAPAQAAGVARINRALAATRAPFVHLLASGCTVTEGWADVALSRFGDRRIASIAPLVLAADDHERIFAAGVEYRPGGARYLACQDHGAAPLPPEAPGKITGACHFAGFFRKSALDFVGGLSGQLGLQQADVDLALVLERAGFTAALETRSCVYATAQVEPRQSALSQALYDERLFWRNLPPAGRIKSLAAHGGLVAIELLRSFGRPRMLAQMAGRAWACCQLGGYLRHHQALAQLARRTLHARPLVEMRVDSPHNVPAHAQAGAARARSR